jgi:hypothetical protein
MNFSELFKKFDLESAMLYIAAIVFFPIVIGFMLIKIVGGAAEGMAEGYTMGAKKRVLTKSLAEGRRPPVGF